MKNIYIHIIFLILGFGQLYTFEYDLGYYMIEKNSYYILINFLNKIIKLYYLIQIGIILYNMHLDDTIIFNMNQSIIENRYVFFTSYKLDNNFILY